jgi:hypothetical protein
LHRLVRVGLVECLLRAARECLARRGRGAGERVVARVPVVRVLVVAGPALERGRD